MVVQTPQVTDEAFEQFVALPENAERHFELVEGEIVEVVSSNYSSEIGMFMGAMLLNHARKHGLGRVTGADGGYMIAGERYIPDAAFIALARQPEPARDAYNPTPPDLVVEVLSPSDKPATTRKKIVNYLRAGVTVWLVDPDAKTVEVYAPDAAPRTLGVAHTLDGGDMLPGFTLPVKEIFGE
jgi:Uma2 family endonuclease